jgi:TonB-dependent SusC/RagA subfamily outer membrane receptor
MLSLNKRKKQQTINKQQTKKRERFMEKRLMMFLAALFLCVGGALAQTKVSGTVVSQDDGQPVIGATVLVVGTQVGTVTNANGQFSLTCPAGKNMLRITYVGMEPLEVSARANMRIMLTSDQRALDEVIVVAYGTQKKSAFTGSAAVINSDEIGKVQVTNAVDALKGKASGVQINTASGQPGSTPTVRIRGINSINAGNSPLYVVDGSPFDGDLNTINPIDIESMTVLKDAASTSLYGARGGNGVILITTKSAKKGRDATITFDAKWGSNQRATPDYEMISSPASWAAWSRVPRSLLRVSASVSGMCREVKSRFRPSSLAF